MSYAKPVTPIIEAPINLDAVIQRIQLALAAKLPWLDYSFGRATLAERAAEPGGGKPLVYPRVYIGKGQYQSVEPNNHYGSHCFLQVSGPEKPVDYERFTRNIYAAEVESVFWFDLDKIKKKMGYPYAHRFTEELKEQIKRAFAGMADVGKIDAVYETPGEVFKGYSYNHLHHQTFAHPYGGFKFVLSVSYLEDCKPLPLPEA